ncbi:hypothetical protein OHD62_00525 [Mesorhizobium sp. YC-39]|uniref:hypothetical protein n=1 Tax=unclassified Mesorhizobium TaxID=325217 RepID=UPI0021E9735B|nr:MULTISPECIES: hypothetical protein [unclassified Mesorhizobium]MCV3206756.1 hypothetical protein [Mesorhizobium sp. YC-2]MCV3226844.1 hypothetical protein [Mesorhizobium sp. YC-39]
MDNERADLDRQKELQANVLARETGVTMNEALMLIELVGPHRGAMLRVAKIVQARKRGGTHHDKAGGP